MGLMGREGAVLAVALAGPRQRDRVIAGKGDPTHPESNLPQSVVTTDWRGVWRVAGKVSSGESPSTQGVLVTVQLKFLAVPLAIGALFLAGCGGDDSSDESTNTGTTEQTQPATNDTAANGAAQNGSPQVLNLAADPSGALAYDTTELTADAGPVQIDFTNESPVPHDVVISDAGGADVARTDVITDSSTSTEFDAKPGDFTFFCSVPGHEAAGMKGTLTVK